MKFPLFQILDAVIDLYEAGHAINDEKLAELIREHCGEKLASLFSAYRFLQKGILK